MLTDTWGDGWNGNVLGIAHDGKLVAEFGQDFTYGSQYGPIHFTLPEGYEFEIVVVVYSLWTE